ncbi:MAG: hypothetical protein DRN33_02990 [Thermoplasmata archaeon]|nr:MAG: hypothetical protein DRN33_02990 [Thermoplasmata archaeon]
MVGKNLVNKIKKHLNLLLLLSITSLILINFLPWIVVSEQTGDIFFNYEMMKKNDNLEVSELTGIIDSIVVLTWMIIILGLICLVGLIVYLSKKFQGLSLLMMGVGSFIFVLVVIVVYLSFRFIQGVREFENISLAYLFTPFSYSFVIFVFMLLSMLISVVVLVYLIMFFWGVYKDFKSAKKKKISFEYSKPQRRVENKKFPSNVIPNSEEEPEDWSEDSEKDKKEEKTQFEKDREQTKKKREKIEEEVKAEETSSKQDEASADLKHEKKPKEEKSDLVEKEVKKTEGKSKLGFHHEFEQVLLSAIEKKKKQKEVSKKELSQSVDKIKKFKVRCLKCKHVFVAEVKDVDKRIKCPACGEEGKL